MTRRELRELAPWIAAGIEAPVAADDEHIPHPNSLRKRYVLALGENVYALTERGAEHAERLARGESEI